MEPITSAPHSEPSTNDARTRRAPSTTCAEVTRKPSAEMTTPLPLPRSPRRCATEGSSRSLAETMTRE